MPKDSVKKKTKAGLQLIKKIKIKKKRKLKQDKRDRDQVSRN